MFPSRTPPATCGGHHVTALRGSLGLEAVDEAQRLGMRQQLGSPLDGQPNARSVFPALVIVERALRTHGAMERLPHDVVFDASRHLSRLAGERSAKDIATLSARVRGLHASRRADHDAEADASPDGWA